MNYTNLYQHVMRSNQVSGHAKMMLKRYENVDPHIALSDLEVLAQVFQQRAEEYEEEHRNE